MMSVNTNTGAMQALQALSANSKSLADTQNRISTGLKVSSAKDGGATYGIAQDMRARVASMNAVNDSLNRGSSILDVAAGAAQSVSDLLAEMKQKALTYSDTSLDTAARVEVRQELRDLVNQIALAVGNATFGGVNLLSGQTETVATYTYGTSVLPSISTSQTFDGEAGIIGVSFQSQNVGSYNVMVTGGQQPAPNNFVNASGSPLVTTGAQIAYGQLGTDQAPVPSQVYFNYSAAPLGGATNYGITNLTVTDEVYTDPAVLTSATGAKQYLGAKPMTPAMLGLTEIDAPQLYDDDGNELGADTLSPMFLTVIDNAFSTVQTYVSQLGTEQNLLGGIKTQNSQMVDTINAGIGNLVDADMATESANLQAEQVKQSLATQNLSIANQQPDWILKLFK